MNEGRARSTAEWISLLASIGVLAVIVGLIAVQIPGGDEPAAPVVTVAGVREVRSTFHVDVVVENDGERTAANVQVTAELTVGSDTFSGDQTIDFLSGGERADLTFVFADDPADGELRVVVSGYAEP